MQALDAIKQMTSKDLASLGLTHVAYVKPVTVEGRIAYSIHAADGTEMGVMEDRDVAFSAIRVHDLEPMSVH
jgi:hypothetical protein